MRCLFGKTPPDEEINLPNEFIVYVIRALYVGTVYLELVDHNGGNRFGNSLASRLVAIKHVPLRVDTASARDVHITPVSCLIKLHKSR